MSIIDDVKKLLAATETECVKGEQGGCPRCAACETLCGVARPIAQALVECQEALSAARGGLYANAEYIMRSTRNAGNDALYSKAVTVWADEARDALRMDGLAKAMKEK